MADHIEDHELKNFLKESISNAGPSSAFIVSPSMRKSLEEKGLVEECPKTTIKEHIDRIFSDRKSKAPNLFEFFQSVPNYHDFDIFTLVNEIQECMLFGTNGAAITLSGVLVEHVLKKGIYFVENENSFLPFNEELDIRIEEGYTMHSAAERARKLGLIKEDLKNAIIEFKEVYRNPYMHYNLRKITKILKFTDITVLNIKKKTTEKIIGDPLIHPHLRIHAKQILDGEGVKEAFRFAVNVTTIVMNKIHDLG